MSAYTIVNSIQGSAEWLAMRKKFVTATDIPALMGESPWDTALSRWEKKMGIRPEAGPNSAMERGIRLEPIARDWFEQKIGDAFPAAVVLSTKYPFMMSSLDGLRDDGRIVLEIKNVNAQDHETALKGHVPKKYIGQLQHQIVNINASMAYYVSFDERNPDKSAIVNVYRDEQYIELMLKKEAEFYRCMTQFCPPSFHEDDYRAISETGWITKGSKYLSNRKVIDALEKENDILKKDMIALSGGSNAKGAGIELSKVTRKGNVDVDTVLKHYKIDTDLDQFRGPKIESWRIRESA